jgi:probable addiction module antidote protein
MPTTTKEPFPPVVSYRNDLLERIRQSSDWGAGYLSAALQEGDDVFLVALKDVVDARGGVSTLAKNTGLHRVSLHRLLSGKGNPRLQNLSKILAALNIQLALAPKAPAKRRAKAS